MCLAVSAADDTLNINSNYDAFIISVNNALNPLDLELAFLHDEITGRQMCALVNRSLITIILPSCLSLRRT